MPPALARAGQQPPGPGRAGLASPATIPRRSAT